MEALLGIYTELIYRPLLNALVLIYAFLPYQDLGLAIIVLTAIVRLAIHPAAVAALRSQQAMVRLQPKLKEIQARYRDHREEQGRQIMAAYREAGVHPLSGCIPILVQIPILFGLYYLFWRGLTAIEPGLLYPFARGVAALDPIAFGFLDLSQPSRWLALAAGATQFLQGWFTPPPSAPAAGAGGDFSRALVWQTKYLFPIIIVFVSWNIPAAVACYWTALNVIVIVQQRWIQKRLSA